MHLMTLDPPYRLNGQQAIFTFRGWTEVNDPEAPRVRLLVNGVETRVEVTPAPEVARHFPGVSASRVQAEVDFARLLTDPRAEIPDRFLLVATLISDHRERSFEYAVDRAWIEKVLGGGVKPKPTPPEDLQIRVTGAAAGEFHRTGRLVAETVLALLEADDRPLAPKARVLDFGCGPARVLANLAEIRPGLQLWGSDIDPEAIAWCSAELGDLAEFQVNGAAPPLPFADEAFDAIYSISIFTHLPEPMQFAWLSELRRVLRPGGVLLTTKLDPAAFDLPAEIKRAGADRGFAYWGDADKTAGLPDFYRLAYHSDAYVHREWGRYFDVLKVGSMDLSGAQDSVLLRRPRHALSWLPPKVRRRLHAAKSTLIPA